MIITQDMKICDVLDMNEELEKVFLKHNLPCLGCPGALQESLAEASKGHGIDINALIKDLNEKL